MTWPPSLRLRSVPGQAWRHYAALAVVAVVAVLGLSRLPGYLSWTSPWSPPVPVGSHEMRVVERFGKPEAIYPIRDLDRVPGLYDGGTRYFPARDMPNLAGMHHALYYSDGNHRCALVIIDHRATVLWTLYGHLR